MTLFPSLKNLCLDFIYDHAKTILDHSSKNGKEDIQRSQLYRLTKVFRSWNVPNFVERVRSQNHDIKWEIRIQDIKNQDYNTLTLCLQSSAELERFKAFLRHLIFNWSQDIKVQKLYDGHLAFVVTHPVPALLCFYLRGHQDSRKHSARFPAAKASDIETVSKTIASLLAKDFCLTSILNEAEKQSSNIAETRQTEETIRSQSPDYPELFRGNEHEIFTTGIHHYDASSDVLLDQLKQAYNTALNQSSQSEYEARIEHSTRSSQSLGSSQNEPKEKLPSRPKRQAVRTRAANFSTKDTQTDLDYEKLKTENAKMKKTIETLSKEREAQMLQIDQLIDENKKIAELIEKREAEMVETMLELGRASVELARYQNEKKRSELFIKTYKSQAMSTQTTELSPTTAGAGVSTDQGASTSNEANRTEAESNEVEGHLDIPFRISIQESLNETGSLTNIPTTGVDGSMYNNYKYLLLRIAHGLLNDDVAKLIQWAQREFGIDATGDVNNIFMELDRKKVISATDLSRLKAFFEDILRIDFVCLIESYLRGDYGLLKNPIPSRRLGSSSRGLSRTQNGLPDQPSRPSRALSRSSSTEVGRSTGIGQDPAVALHDAVTALQRKFQRSRLTETQAGRTFGNSEGMSSSIQHSTTRPDSRIGPESQGASSRKPFPLAVERTSFLPGRGKETARNVSSSSSQGVVVVDGGRSEESEAPQRTAQASARSSTVRADQTNTSRNTDSGSNGLKLSKFQQPDDSGGNNTQRRGNRANGGNLDDQWLCSHYKRRCYVQFECCNKFWPCHRCHNNQSSCGRKKLKSRDTKRIKCVACGLEQQFAQYCSRCNAKFAKYFCGLCKHLTGTDDNPYHCQKCGICRIHGDRSFHCDICGVCLDVQLRGNHKCREGSAHDECCICLEDAFTGCQILPCSHKVHKDCATQMIRSGITRCPICRESFAHKLERRPHPSKKPPGK